MPAAISEEDYPNWFARTVHVDLADQRNAYESQANDRAREATDSPFWNVVRTALRERADQHQVDRQLPLLAQRDVNLLTFSPKPWESFLSKTYRRNVSENSNWPDSPDTGWITPDNWFQLISDVVRTSVVTKYLDGVSIVASLLTDTALALGRPMTCECTYQARMEGYYAAHVVVQVPFALPDDKWSITLAPGPVEVQVFTQMQDVIRDLTHPLYDSRRRGENSLNVDAFWDYQGAQFVPTYLGHLLHYLDGAIMNFRERTVKSSSDS